MRLGLRPRIGALLLALVSPVLAQNCKVLDPELQESYAGPCVDGLAEGKGIKSWPNGDRYEGEFAADHKDGFGTYQWGEGPWKGERYEGSFAQDRRQGYGMYWWPGG